MALTENSDLLQTVFDSSTNGIAVLQPVYDEPGRVTDFSILLLNAHVLSRVGEADYKGKRYGDFFPAFRENGILEKLIGVAETGIPAAFEGSYGNEMADQQIRFRAVRQGDLLIVSTEDITEQMKAESAIRQAEERFRFALQAGHLGSWELNLATLDLNASEHCKKIFGQPGGVPFTYQTLTESIHPGDRQRQKEAVAATISSGCDYDIEYRIIWPDGTLHWVNVRGQLHLDEAGKPDYMIGVSVDISDRKRTEAALTELLDSTEKQQRLYDSITNTTPDLVYVFDLNYRFTYANKALLTMWGKTAEEAIDKGLRDNGYEEWHALMHEREIDEVVATKKTIRGTVSFPHAELGSRIYDYIFAPVLNESGEVEAVAGTTRDITELKRAEEKLQQSEARFRNLLKEAPVAATLFRGPELIIEIANKLTQEYWGKGPEIIGKPIAEAAPELEQQQMIALLDDIYQRGGIASFSETPITFTKNGIVKEGYYTHSMKALYDSEGHVESILAIGIDVTEQVKNRKRIEESEGRLKLMIDQTPAPTLLLMGDDLVIEQINKPMLQMIGHGEEVIGLPLISIMPELEGQYIWEQVKKVYHEGISFDQSEVLVPHKRNGVMQDYYYNIAYRPLREEERVTGMIQVAIDVTEQVMARKRLEESEVRFRNMVEQAPVATCLFVGRDMKIEIANDIMIQYWGKGNSVIGKPFAEAVPELIGQPFLQQLDEVFSTGKAFEKKAAPAELIIDGVRRIYYFDYTYKPVFDETGAIYGIMDMAMDVTEQVIAQKKLEESESHFRALVNSSSDVVYRMNADWTIMRNLVGRGFLSDTGEPIPDWIEKYIHPDDHKTVREVIDSAIAAKGIFELEHRVLNADGVLGWTFSRAIPILDDQGNIVEWFGSASDVTARKEVQEIIRESEEKFRQLADLVPEIIWTSKADGSIDYYNKRWYEYSGFTEKPFSNENWFSIMHPNDVPAVMEQWSDSIENGTPFQLEFRLKNGDTGEYRWFLSKGLPIRDKAGSITKWFGSSTDIQEQKINTEKLEKLVAERTRELQRSNEDLQQFAHVASHDLKEPVRKVKIFTGRLEQHLAGKLDTPSTQYLEKINVATNRMVTMIDGVLAYSTINAGTQKPEPVDLNEVIKNIDTDLEVALQKTGGVIHYHKLPKLEGAPVLLYQLFYNLINNSIKFARADVPPQITISSTTMVEDDTSVAHITLQDNGIGFEPEESEQIFETFTRLHSKDKYEGTGLGLSLCKKIVERHGGSITANGSPDKGATFTIKLPLQQKGTWI